VISLPRRVRYVGLGVLGVVCFAGLRPADNAPIPTPPCTFRVSADVLNVRGGPNPGDQKITQLQHGALVTVASAAQNGFFPLEAGGWAAREFLTPAPGSTCP
jgi:hypothetical protein